MSTPTNELLGALNEATEGVEILQAAMSAQNRPICVVGLPRSGTTLAVQLMVSRLDVGWISNIAARFWTNPAMGVFLQTQLDDRHFSSSMRSTLGQTSGPLEPHEFGRFWLDSLQLDLLSLDPRDRPAVVDVARLVADLRRVAHVAAKPVVYKSFVVPIAIEQLIALIPDLLIVRVRRDLVDVAASLLRAHLQTPQNADGWIGVRPAGWRPLSGLPAEERIAHQVVEVERYYDEQLRSLPQHNILNADYTTLASEPSRFIDAVVARGVGRRPSPQPDSQREPQLDEVTMKRLTTTIAKLTDV